MTDALLAEHARDPLTGLGTKRALVRVYQREIERRQEAALRSTQAGRAGQAGRNGAAGETLHPIAVLFADVNQLRHINEQFGRSAGDDVLRTAGAVLSAIARPEDVVVRYGGDEFVVLMPGADDARAEAFADEARATLRRRSEDTPFTVSFGTAVVDTPTAPSLDHLVMLADLRAYREKARQETSAAMATPVHDGPAAVVDAGAELAGE
jgi:diguanylate cyclase (GGDEF)-like protein